MSPVDINHASLSLLESLPGIGAALAERIIQYRRNTPFRTIDELLTVKGIGPRKLESLSPLVVLDSETATLRGKPSPSIVQHADPGAAGVCVTDALSAWRKWQPGGSV